MIGERLKLARRAASLSLRDLEAKTGSIVSAQAIGKYERNQMAPGSSVLLALAKALEVSPSYLLSKKELSIQEVDFRKGHNVAAKDEKALEALVLEYAERYIQIEEFLPDARIVWQTPVDKEFYIGAIEEAEGAARKLREKWNLGISPISSVVELLENKGIKILSTKLPNDISASKGYATQINGDRAALIVINSEHNGERQRFSLAHELAHFVLRFKTEFSHREQEKAADRFAGAFLIAQELLLMFVGKSRHLITISELLSIKKVIKVSIACLVVRCRQLGIISQAVYQDIWGEIKANGLVDFAKAEPEPIASEKPERMQRLVLRAAGEGIISDSKAGELLKISSRKIDELLNFQPAA